MLSDTQLREALASPSLNRTQKLLICVAADPVGPKSVAQIMDIAESAGLRVARRWNVSGLLSSAKGRAIRLKDGWDLGEAGRDEVRTLVGTGPSKATKTAVELRVFLPKIANADVAAFVEESISCFEAHLYRAAIVLSWVGALALLYDHVVAKELAAFNAEASKRDAKWRPAKTADDLARMNEFEFLQVAEKISVIGKSVKHELEVALKLRNGCGHPNSLKVGENKTAAHIETLILNVFSKFA